MYEIAETRKCELSDLSISDLKSIEGKITASIFSIMSVENSVNSKNSFGGTAPSQVSTQLKKMEEENYFEKYCLSNHNFLCSHIVWNKR